MNVHIKFLSLSNKRTTTPKVDPLMSKSSAVLNLNFVLIKPSFVIENSIKITKYKILTL